MGYFGWDYMEAGNKLTPYQIKHGGKIMDFKKSQENKTLASIIRMHQADQKDFSNFFDKL